ncbi:MAG: hypothetical protein ACSHXF_08180 [Aquaticitalea sp.]
MRIAHHLNLFAVGLPVMLCLLGILDEQFLFYGLISTMLTGFIQVIIGIKLFLDEPKNKCLQIYLISVAVFFFLWVVFANAQNYFKPLIYILLAMPPTLAIYLTIIIIKKLKK